MPVIRCSDLVSCRVKKYGHRDSTGKIDSKFFRNFPVPVELADVDMGEMKYVVGELLDLTSPQAVVKRAAIHTPIGAERDHQEFAVL